MMLSIVTIFFTNSTIRSRFKVKLHIIIFCTLSTSGLILLVTFYINTQILQYPHFYQSWLQIKPIIYDINLYKTRELYVSLWI